MPGQTPPRRPAASAARDGQRRAARPPALLTPAVAGRARQLAAHAEHRRAIAEFHARRVTEQQARVNALLLETVAALASLFGAPANPPT